MIIVNSIIEKVKYYIKTGFFHIFGANVINKIIGFFSSIILVRIISKAEYGGYSYVLNIISTAEIFTAMGMVSGVFQICSENISNIEKKNRVYKYGSAFGIYFNLMLSLVLLIIAWLMKFPIAGVNLLLRFAFLIPLSSVLAEFQNIRLRSDLKTKEYSYANILGTFMIALGTILGAILYRGKGAFVFRTISYLITYFIIFRLTHVGVSVHFPKLERQEKKDLFSVSFVSMINTGLSQLLYLVDIYVIGLVLTNNEAVASYKVATTIPTALTFIPSSLIVYIYPYFASHKSDPEWIWKSYKKYSIGLLIFNLGLVSVFFVFSKFFIILIFGKQYLDAVGSFRILLINYLVAASLKILIGNIMVMLRRLKYNLFETLLSSGLNIVADYYLIKYYSIEGAAFATLGVTVVISLISLDYLYYIYRKNNGEN